MNKDTRRVTLDVIDARAAQLEAMEQGCQFEILEPSGPSGHPFCALYGPRLVVDVLLTKWGYDEKGR